MAGKEAKYRRITSVKDTDPGLYKIKRKLEKFDPGKVVKRIQSLPLSVREEYSTRKTPVTIFDVEEFSETQSLRVIKRFGGVTTLLNAFEKIGKPRSRSTVYRWLYSRKRGGTDGLIPTSVWPDLLVAARLEGIFLSTEDFEVREQQLNRFTPIAVLEDGKIKPFLASHEVQKVLDHQAQKKNRAEKRKERTIRRKLSFLARKRKLRNLKKAKQAELRAKKKAMKCITPK